MPEQTYLTPHPSVNARRKFLLRSLLYGSVCACLLGVAAVIGAGYLVLSWQRELPDHGFLLEYEPPMQTRIYAGDGALLAEYGRQRRFHIPYDAIPSTLVHAFLSAEDKNFFRHGGIDLLGIGRAALQNVSLYLEGRRPVGASTITQQVAKNFLLSREVSLERKGKEILLALSIERALSKERILELYLNEIYLGFGSYGVAAAALNYFDKSLNDLTIAEAAYLAALAKGPANYHPVNRKENALGRRNWVISRMLEDDHISGAEAATAEAEPLEAVPQRRWGAQLVGAEYFVEEIRRQLYEQYGEDKLYESGMLVRATLSPRLQTFAQQALRNGLIDYDRRHGWRGPLANIASNDNWQENWLTSLADIEIPEDLAPWQLAVVLDVATDRASIGLLGAEADAPSLIGVLPFEEVAWAAPWRKGQRVGAQPKEVGDVLAVGDVIYVEALPPDGNSDGAQFYALRQLPEVNGALVALDPFTGRVLAMQGGFSFNASEFNRAWQANRQPGSAFKPFVYAIALENGYTPATILLDAPVAIDPGAGQKTWKPQNYTRKFYGPQTMRAGVEKSRNVMTVRLAYALGMDVVADELTDFNLFDRFPPLLSMVLGAGETSLMRMAIGYASFVNGGRKVTPTLIDRIQDRYGNTLYRFDQRDCSDCAQEEWNRQMPPRLKESRDLLITPQSAYQMVSILEGVVQRGTGRSLLSLNRPVAGKTGTTNDERDAWFMGFSPDLVVGVYVGFDEPRPLGYRETGGRVAAPVFREFMSLALEGEQPIPFRVPAGIRFIHIDAANGEMVRPGTEGSILEAFKLSGPGPNIPGTTASGSNFLNDQASLPEELFRTPDGIDRTRKTIAPTHASVRDQNDANTLDGQQEVGSPLSIIAPSTRATAKPKSFDEGLY